MKDKTTKTIITQKRNAGLTRLLFALGTAAAANNNSRFEQVFGCEPKTFDEIITERRKHCLDNDQTLKLFPDEFPEGDDSTIFQRDRTRNPQLEGQFKKKPGTIVAESSHTVTMEINRGRQVLSKGDAAKNEKRLTQLKNKQ